MAKTKAVKCPKVKINSRSTLPRYSDEELTLLAERVGHNGKFTRTKNPIRTTPKHRNFLIVHVQYGDWSGFRTLAECEKQFPELEAYHAATPSREYAVVERL